MERYTHTLLLLTLSLFLCLPHLHEANAERPGLNESSAQKDSKKKRRKRKRLKTAKKSSSDGAVDLDALDNESSATNRSPYKGRPAPSGDKSVQFFFDLLLAYQPNTHPISFDNHHTVFLVDYAPRPEIRFSFGIAPPLLPLRFYELDYQLTKKLQLRLGRIWIPFDQVNPHNTFGGIMNTSIFRSANQTAFLPDIWADLGIGLKFDLIDLPDLQVVNHWYIVNGFGDGATDPLGQAPAYPDFSLTSNRTDNNDDKAIGSRIHALVGRAVGIGASAYWGRWTDQNTANGRILMLGVDGQLRFWKSFEAKAGYAFMRVGLPGSANRSSFIRGGAYVNISQRFSRRWKVTIRGGIMQNDNTVSDANDRTLAGAQVTWYPNPMLLASAEMHHDLASDPTKTNRTYAAIRLGLKL